MAILTPKWKALFVVLNRSASLGESLLWQTIRRKATPLESTWVERTCASQPILVPLGCWKRFSYQRASQQDGLRLSKICAVRSSILKIGFPVNIRWPASESVLRDRWNYRPGVCTILQI